MADSLSLLQKMHRTQMRGVRVDGGCSFSLELALGREISCTNVDSLYVQRKISVNRVTLQYYHQVSLSCVSMLVFFWVGGLWLFSDMPLFQTWANLSGW